MNIPAYLSATRVAGNPAGTNPQTAQPRPQSTTPAQAPAQTSALPREAAQQTPAARPVLDLSDTALTRRDIPRGSFIDIVA